MNASIYAIPGCVAIRQIKKEAQIKKKQSDFDLFKEVCEISGQDPIEVMKFNGVRKREYVTVRQITMSLLHMKNNRSLTYAGGYFRKNHATVIHSMKTTQNLLDTNALYRMQYSHLFTGLVFPVYGNYKPYTR